MEIQENDECIVYCYTHEAFSDNTKGHVMIKEGDHVTNFRWEHGQNKSFNIYSELREADANGVSRVVLKIDPFFGLINQDVLSIQALVTAIGRVKKGTTKLKILSKDILHRLREMLYRSPYNKETNSGYHSIRTRGTFLLLSKATKRPFLKVTVRPPPKL